MADRDLTQGVPADDLTDGRLVAGKIGDTPVVLVRHAGKVCALAGECTHLKAPLEDGLLVDGTLRCPWHHARFDVETGEAVGAPAFKSLDRFQVVETNGLITIGDKIAPSTADVSPPVIGRVVIVGGGAAGHACADMLARHGAGASVTILSDDADAPYDRTFCSKQYLAGKADRDDAMLPVPGGDSMASATVRTGVTVTQIDPDTTQVETKDGERIAFDTLVLATGATPVSPDFDGAERDDVHVLRTLRDADALIDAAKGARAAIVVGASYIGLEVAASLTQRGLSVTVIAEGDIPLEKTAGPEVGGLVRSLHEDKGVTFHMGCKVARWDGGQATLDDGSTVSGDIIVAGMGVTPRIDLAEAAGLTMAGKDAGGGVAVDATLRTSQADIYAIGDIASVPDPRLGHAIRVEHWVVAQRMGQWLARYLLGHDVGDYGDTPFFWSGHYDTSLRYVGHVAATDDRTIDGDVADKDFAVRFREDGAEQALLTCGRDLASLKAEADWDR